MEVKARTTQVDEKFLYLTYEDLKKYFEVNGVSLNQDESIDVGISIPGSNGEFWGVIYPTSGRKIVLSLRRVTSG